MLRLFFLRHGNTFEDGEPSRQVGAKTDIPLTEKGRAQAEKAAAWFKAQGITPAAMIYAGNLKRQKETAALVSQALNVPVATTDELSELSYGAWENLTIEELKEKFPESYEAWSRAGEWPAEFEGTSEEALSRISAFLEMVRGAHGEDGVVLAVTSQGVMKLVTSVIEPERWADLQARREIDALKVRTGALSEIVFDQGAWKTVAWNVIPE